MQQNLGQKLLYAVVYNLYSSSGSNPDSVRPKLEVTWSQIPRTVYFLKDHLGSIRASVQDTTGAPVCGYDDYVPWGYILAGRSMSTAAEVPTATKNKFTGKEYDDEFGLNWNYFGARYYDPQIGRWVVRDPLAHKYPSWSPYVYTLDNPVKLLDPDGKQIKGGIGIPGIRHQFFGGLPTSERMATLGIVKVATARETVVAGLNAVQTASQVTNVVALGTASVSATIPGGQEVAGGALVVAEGADILGAVAAAGKAFVTETPGDISDAIIQGVFVALPGQVENLILGKIKGLTGDVEKYLKSLLGAAGELTEELAQNLARVSELARSR
jgi:RHS repeat-associated protein